MFALPVFTVRGSDASAAGGGYSELSEWQWSADEEGALRQRRCRAPQQDTIVLSSASVQWTVIGRKKPRPFGRGFMFALPIFT